MIDTMDGLIIPGLILFVLVFFVYKFCAHIMYEYHDRPVRRFFAFLFSIPLFPLVFPAFVICWILDAEGIRSRPPGYDPNDPDDYDDLPFLD